MDQIHHGYLAGGGKSRGVLRLGQLRQPVARRTRAACQVLSVRPVLPSLPTTRGPTVTSVSPSGGGYNGGTSVVVQGTGFLSATEVAFGGIAGTNLSITSDGLLTITSPAHSAGKVDVQVTNPAGTSNANPADDSFTYSALYTPTISVTNSPTSPTLGQGVTFTATVTGRSGGATPSGAITWNLSGQVTSCASITTLTGSGSPAGTATATCTITAAKAGGYSAYASVAADSNYTAAGPSSTDTFSGRHGHADDRGDQLADLADPGPERDLHRDGHRSEWWRHPVRGRHLEPHGSGDELRLDHPTERQQQRGHCNVHDHSLHGGGYSAYASVAADSNYNAAGPSSTDTFTVAKATPTVRGDQLADSADLGQGVNSTATGAHRPKWWRDPVRGRHLEPHGSGQQPRLDHRH